MDASSSTLNATHAVATYAAVIYIVRIIGEVLIALCLCCLYMVLQVPAKPTWSFLASYGDDIILSCWDAVTEFTYGCTLLQ